MLRLENGTGSKPHGTAANRDLLCLPLFTDVTISYYETPMPKDKSFLVQTAQ